MNTNERQISQTVLCSMCVCMWTTQRKKERYLRSHIHAFLQYWMCSSVGFFFPPTSSSFIIIFPHSYVSMTSGSLLSPVHRSLIKASNEEVMHNFISSSSTSGTFSYFTKIYDSFLLKGHNSPSVAGIGVTDAKWAIYRFLVEGEYCVESFQTSHWGYLTPHGLICSRWYVW